MLLGAKKYIVSFSLALLAFACSPRHTLNTIFQEKYGKEIETINASRTLPIVAPQDLNKKLDFSPYVPEDKTSQVDERYLSHEQYYANADAVEYGSRGARETFPNQDMLVQAKNSETLPENMFQISYYTQPSQPFKRMGSEFDHIEIPQKDAYGIVTAASHKQYFLVGNKSLQQNVDHIKSLRSTQDISDSEQLIVENKQIRRRLKNMKVFGKDYVGIAPPVILVEGDKKEEQKEQELEQDKVDKAQDNQNPDQEAITVDQVKKLEPVLNKDKVNEVK